MTSTNLLWDADTQEELELLPIEIDIQEDITEDDEISDYLSDVSGYCHHGFSLDSDE